MNLAPDLDATVAELMRGGGYDSRHEVLREALAALKLHEADRRRRQEELRAAVALGLAEAEQGELHDADEVFAEFLGPASQP